MKEIITILLLSLSCVSFSQNSAVQMRLITMDSTIIDSLKCIYGYNKEIPLRYAAPIYMALSHYPELDSSKIVFKYIKIKTTLNVRPTVFSMIFRKRSERKYVIRINNTLKDSVFLLNNSIPFNAMIGLFGHEFSHVIDYNSKNIFGVLSRLISYTNNNSKEKFEKGIDTITIKRGLGWQLYDWSYYVLEESIGTAKYKKFKRLIYLEPDEIKEIITSSNNRYK